MDTGQLDTGTLLAHRVALLEQVLVIDRDLAQRFAFQKSSDPGAVVHSRGEYSEAAAPDRVDVPHGPPEAQVFCAGCGRQFPKPKYRHDGSYVCVPCRYEPVCA